MVVVQKFGAIRVCMDLKKLSENVFRGVHLMPKVHETLALLAGVTIFFKLNAYSEF